MSWIAIAGGANGLFFYSEFDLAQEGMADPAAAAALWQAPARVATEVSRFAPILLSNRAPHSPTVLGGTLSWLMLRCHSYPNEAAGIYIFAVSDGTGGGAVTLQLSHGQALSVTVVSEEPIRRVKLGGGGVRFSDDIASMAVVVYKVELNQHDDFTVMEAPAVSVRMKNDDRTLPTPTNYYTVQSVSPRRCPVGGMAADGKPQLLMFTGTDFSALAGLPLYCWLSESRCGWHWDLIHVA